MAKIELERRQFMVLTALAGGGLAIDIVGSPSEAEAQTAAAAKAAALKSPAAAASAPEKAGQVRGHAVMQHGPNPVNPKPWLPPEEGGMEVGQWVVISKDNCVTFRVNQNEEGQGVMTSNALMFCEELECDWSKVRSMYVDVQRQALTGAYSQARSGDMPRTTGIGTGASSSVRNGRWTYQTAGAHVRERLRFAAAVEWGVSIDDVVAKNSILTHKPTGRTFTYGDMAERASKLSIIDEPHIKKPSEFSTSIGKRVRLLDCDIKVYGQATYGIDVRLPDMLYAAVRLCPTFGGSLKSYQFDAIKGRKGVISAVPLQPGNAKEPEGVAIVADSWWRAKSALDAMPIEWNEGPHANESSKDYFAQFHAELAKPGNVVFDEGDTKAALNGPGQTLEAIYEYPHQACYQMEPPACTALVTADRVDVWGSDGTDAEVRNAARITGLPVDKSFFHWTFAGGSFGGAGSDRPPLSHAVQVAKTVPGKPVKVVVNREMDLRKGRYRPMGVARCVGKVGADGMPTAIYFRCATSSHGRPAVPIGKHEVKMEAHSSWGFASVPYAAPNVMSEVTEMHTAIPIATWRAPGHCTAAFIIETFIDELAHAGGKDPYQFRRQLLAANKGHDPSFRHKDAWIKALDIVAKASNWGTPLPKGTGRGIGIDDRRKHTHPDVQAVYTDSSLITIAATVAEVTVSKDGRVSLNNVYIAHDSGVPHGIINPEAVEKEILGQIAWAWSAGYLQELTVDKGRIVQGNFNDYPVIRMRDFPKHVEIYEFFKNEWISGAGEEAIPGILPAICNAIFAATGKRIRTLPVTKTDLSWT